MFYDHCLKHLLTSKVSFEELDWTIFDRLDIFSDAIDLKNMLVLLFLRHLHPIIDSEWSNFAVYYNIR